MAKGNEAVEDIKPMYTQSVSWAEEFKILNNINYAEITNTKSEDIPKCPTCGSTNVRKISTGKKAFGFAIVGLFSSNLGKTMECKNCGCKW